MGYKSIRGVDTGGWELGEPCKRKNKEGGGEVEDVCEIVGEERKGDE